MAVTDRTEAAELAARAARVIPGGVNSGQRRVPGLEELVIAATSGSTFTDGEGNTYTDYHAAFGPPLLGHNDPDVDGAVAAAAREVGLMGIGVTRIEVELAEKICELVPSVERVLLTETGSEATFHALRVARAATGRRHIDQVPGLLPRLARLGRDERDLAARERRQEGPALEGDPPRGARRDDRLPLQRRRRGRARARPTTTSPRSSSSRSRTTSAPCCRSRASSSGCASSRRSTAPC